MAKVSSLLLAIMAAIAFSAAYAFVSPFAGVVATRSSTAPRMSASPAAVQQGIVTVYHKETCPYCIKVLDLLENDYGLKVTRVNVLEGEDAPKKLKQMRTFSGGRNTVPQVFFNSEHLGGNDDVQTLHSDGKLKDLVGSVLSEPASLQAGWYHPWY